MPGLAMHGSVLPTFTVRITAHQCGGAVVWPLQHKRYHVLVKATVVSIVGYCLRAVST